ncbi:MAG TPA: 2-dehydro-3-deoxy-D-gluconate 5-dehydrogenase KduD [Steroidobacteraceae bacterium]|nr:2-dehydro-3-deoxy-D-gluconate 5-dehydrogenase KduD [Steroidobacteraceae bacterium]
MNFLFDLHGKVAMVTGANTGIGQAIAVALASAGATIVTVSRGDVSETSRLVIATGQRCIDLKADLASTKPIPALVEEAIKQAGGIDILVNNAGIIKRNPALEYTEEDWDAVINVNLKSVFFLSQAVARHMSTKNRGKIINIASMLSFQGGMRVAAYTASKSAIAGVTKLLANEWASRGINVNAIAPGYIETNNTAALREDEARNKSILARIPAGRWGKPEDMGGAAIFLSSAAADYMHGAIVPVDGGWLAS